MSHEIKLLFPVPSSYTTFLNFWGHLPWASKAEWISRLCALSCNGFLRITFGATPADLLAASKEAVPFWPTYLQMCKQALVGLILECVYSDKYCITFAFPCFLYVARNGCRNDVQTELIECRNMKCKIWNISLKTDVIHNEWTWSLIPTTSPYITGKKVEKETLKIVDKSCWHQLSKVYISFAFYGLCCGVCPVCVEVYVTTIGFTIRT